MIPEGDHSDDLFWEISRREIFTKLIRIYKKIKWKMNLSNYYEPIYPVTEFQRVC